MSQEEKQVSDRLVWADIETTGSEEHDIILEVAVIVTDNELNEMGSFSSLVLDCDPRNLIRAGHPRTKDSDIPCYEAHFESGLVMELIEELGRDNIDPTISVVQDGIIRFLNGHGIFENMDPKVPLCGSSVHFDRGHLERRMPKFMELLHYRNIDVSSVRELQRRWAPGLLLKENDEEPYHRARKDLQYSIELLRTFRKIGFLGV